MCILIGRCAVAKNLVITDRILIDSATVAGVALDRINLAVFDFLDNALAEQLPFCFLSVLCIGDNITERLLIGIAVLGL